MKSLWNEAEAQLCGTDLLKLRVYTSRLLGMEEDLVLHGGGNTSVKIKEKNIFGDTEDILFVKGSGWDLATIEAGGFAPVRLEALLRLATLDQLSDMDMVKYQRMAMTDPSAPNPSVEAILHAIIPFTFVDHTHADAVVTITNTPEGSFQIEEIYGPNMLVVPYVMPGFILAKTIYEMTQDIDWSELEGMILLNHGVFTFDNDARRSYEKMIHIVDRAERFLKKEKATETDGEEAGDIDITLLASIRREVSDRWGQPILSRLDSSPTAVGFSNRKDARDITSRGPMTPDHIIRTKRTPVYLTDNYADDITAYTQAYHDYFERHKTDEQELDPAPRWAILPSYGTLSFGPSVVHVDIIQDIVRHTKKAIAQAETLGGWRALSSKDLFEMEYWSLEQAKLKKNAAPKPLQGRIAIVTGAASGIGKACVDQLVAGGAVVGALDIDSTITDCFSSKSVLGIKCDVTDQSQLTKALEEVVLSFGGLDMIISNAGIFPKSAHIADMPVKEWDRSLAINLSSHQRLIQLATPILQQGIDPAILIMGSKNVPAPGPGAAAYSVAKAGLTQLARVAALELGQHGIRVNVLHPNAVYDTGIWTEEVLTARASHYGLTVQEYKTNNVLKQEVSSTDVAQLAVAMCGPLFAKVTGAQVPIDGGNDRVI